MADELHGQGQRSFDKAKDEVSEFAEATVLKHEIIKLNDKRVSLLQDIGQEAYSMYRSGHGVAETRGAVPGGARH